MFVLCLRWHLGFCNWNYTPTYRGFDSFYGFYSGAEDYYTHRHGKNRPSVFPNFRTSKLWEKKRSWCSPHLNKLFCHLGIVCKVLLFKIYCCLKAVCIINVYILFALFFSDGGYDFRFNRSVHHPPKRKYSTVSSIVAKGNNSIRLISNVLHQLQTMGTDKKHTKRRTALYSLLISIKSDCCNAFIWTNFEAKSHIWWKFVTEPYMSIL